MASDRDQDKWLERLVARPVADGRRSAPSEPTAACLDAGLLAAWADGSLRGEQRAAAELHASQCSRCLALVAALQRTMPATEPTRTRGALWRWWAPLAAAATAVAIWVAVPQQRQQQQQSKPVERGAESIAPVPVPAPPAAPSVREETTPPRSVAEPSARADAQQRQSRDRIELKAERGAAAASETAAAPSQPGAPSSPAAVAPAPAANDRLADAPAAARRSMNKVDAIEAAGTDPLVRWRVVSGTDVERSTDGGQTWIKTANPRGRIVSIRDVDALRATVTTADGSVFATEDGGVVWTPVQEKPPAPF